MTSYNFYTVILLIFVYDTAWTSWPCRSLFKCLLTKKYFFSMICRSRVAQRHIWGKKKFVVRLWCSNDNMRWFFFFLSFLFLPHMPYRYICEMTIHVFVLPPNIPFKWCGVHTFAMTNINEREKCEERQLCLYVALLFIVDVLPFFLILLVDLDI